MSLSRWQRPLLAAAGGMAAPSSAVRPGLLLSGALALPLRPAAPAPATTLPGFDVSARRTAAVKAQGAYKLRPKRTIPKKLGAKRATGGWKE
jgi:hypothetical protein